MKISKKLILSFSLASFLMASVGYIDHQILQHTENKVDTITEAIYPVIGTLQEVRYYSQASITNSMEILMHSAKVDNTLHETHKETHSLNKSNTLSNITSLRIATNKHFNLVVSNFPGEIEKADEISTTTLKLENLANKIIALDEDNASTDTIAELHKQLIQLNDEVSSNIKMSIANEQLELDEHHEQIEELVAMSLQKSMLVTGIAFFVLLLLWSFVNKKISRPPDQVA